MLQAQQPLKVQINNIPLKALKYKLNQIQMKVK